MGDPFEIDVKAPPFDQLRHIQPLGRDRSGRGSGGHARHLLYVARDKRTQGQVLIKLTAKPGLIYQQNLSNEIQTLTSINRGLPDSRYFPWLGDHGRLPDGRVFLIISLFSEFPLATTIGTERMTDRTVTHLRTAIETAAALAQLHSLNIFHVDLNTMNVLYRAEHGKPVIRIVDFESSYEVGRHGAGASYNPPTTEGYCAPELSARAPDARADIFSLGAVLYTMLAGFSWTWESNAPAAVDADRDLDAELKAILRRAVALDPDERFASISELAAALSTHLNRIWPGRSW